MVDEGTTDKIERLVYMKGLENNMSRVIKNYDL